MNPSPIASPVGWAGVHEQLWFINGLQKSLFPDRSDDDGEARAARRGSPADAARIKTEPLR